MARPAKKIYRVSFYSQGKVVEIYARQIASSNLFGFVEVEELLFGEKSSILVDPSEESLRAEFENIKRSFIPMHAIIRMDEMEKDVNLKPRVVSLPSNAKGKKEKKSQSISSLYTPNNPFMPS